MNPLPSIPSSSTHSLAQMPSTTMPSANAVAQKPRDNALVQKPPESHIAGDLGDIPIEDVLKELEEKFEAINRKMDKLEPRVEHYAQNVQEHSQELAQKLEKLEADVAEEEVAWENTERLLGAALVTMTVATVVVQETAATNSNNKNRAAGPGPRRTQGRQ